MKCLIENIEVNYPCSATCSLYGDCMTAFLESRKQRVRTNADRIRAMTDEELQKFLNSIYSAGTRDGNMRDGFSWDLEWLRNPARED